METRANFVWVGAVTLALVAMLAAAIIWIARLNEGTQNQFDIFFRQSVDGLAKGSEVSYSGVPVGQIKEIELWERDPSFIRVRISVGENVPIVVGTTATIQGSFTGVSDIQLEGAIKGAPPITEKGPEGVPVIPTTVLRRARSKGLGGTKPVSYVWLLRPGNVLVAATAIVGNQLLPIVALVPPDAGSESIESVVPA